MSPCMCEHGYAGFPETVFFVAVGRIEFRRLRSRINRHALSDSMSQINYFHFSPRIFLHQQDWCAEGCRWQEELPYRSW